MLRFGEWLRPVRSPTEATEYARAYAPVDATPEVRAVTVRNSYRTLTAIEASVRADAANIAGQGATLHRVDVDLLRNVVIAAFVDAPDELRERILSAYAGPDVLVAATNTGVRRKLNRS